MTTLTLQSIASLFENHGAAYYGVEAISQTAHALQQTPHLAHYLDMATRCVRPA